MSMYLCSLLLMFQPLNLFLIIITSVAGIIFGAIPGLSAAIGISLLVPITIGMDTTTSFVMPLAMYVSGVSGSFIGATLIGIPGSSSSIATTFDAYPMTQRGEASKALTIGIVASFLGTFLSILVATFLSPMIADFALKLGPWEYASLCFCAITLVAALSQGSMFKCILSASIGLMLGTIGIDQVSGVTRFTFGNHNLDGGIWASETSNNASIGGAIIPMMALGIPGDSITAMLLTGLMIHGLQPGPLMITSSPEISYLIFAGILVCAVITLVMQLLTKRWFPLILKIPYHYLYSAILIIAFIGAYGTANSIFSIYVMIGCSIFGVIMELGKLPTSPFILAFILSQNLEAYFRKGVSYADGNYMTFLTRPVSLIFILVAVFSVVCPICIKCFFKKECKL